MDTPALNQHVVFDRPCSVLRRVMCHPQNKKAARVDLSCQSPRVSINVLDPEGSSSQFILLEISWSVVSCRKLGEFGGKSMSKI